MQGVGILIQRDGLHQGLLGWLGRSDNVATLPFEIRVWGELEYINKQVLNTYAYIYDIHSCIYRNGL